MFTGHLFVYGTLMSVASGPLGCAQRRRLQREAKSLGRATTPGRLYDLGRYPGLLASASAAHLVHGEVFALRNPAATLRWLDRYEGIARGEQNRGEYRRATRPVRLADGRKLTAWVYLYARRPNAARLLNNGRWLTE
ncbi:MAG TPA: gamma-glutamylcyclotransferase family protein [Hyphomicrobiaceae bacterium]|nr:gamma-glutamylcyclotransferase family protein [Hyphomicrobiaceae bacterium]